MWTCALTPSYLNSAKTVFRTAPQPRRPWPGLREHEVHRPERSILHSLTRPAGRLPCEHHRGPRGACVPWLTHPWDAEGLGHGFLQQSLHTTPVLISPVRAFTMYFPSSGVALSRRDFTHGLPRRVEPLPLGPAQPLERLPKVDQGQWLVEAGRSPSSPPGAPGPPPPGPRALGRSREIPACVAPVISRISVQQR